MKWCTTSRSMIQLISENAPRCVCVCVCVCKASLKRIIWWWEKDYYAICPYRSPKAYSTCLKGNIKTSRVHGFNLTEYQNVRSFVCLFSDVRACVTSSVTVVLNVLSRDWGDTELEKCNGCNNLYISLPPFNVIFHPYHHHQSVCVYFSV